MIREHAAQDVEAIVEVWRAASEIATPFLPDEFLAGEPDNIRNVYIPMAETWVFEVEGAVAGFIALIGNEVGAIFVHPEYQGRGIGRALMDHAAGIRDSLFLDVFEENTIGRGFYDAYGFRIESEHVFEPTGDTQLRLVYTP